MEDSLHYHRSSMVPSNPPSPMMPSSTNNVTLFKYSGSGNSLVLDALALSMPRICSIAPSSSSSLFPLRRLAFRLSNFLPSLCSPYMHFVPPEELWYFPPYFPLLLLFAPHLELCIDMLRDKVSEFAKYDISRNTNFTMKKRDDVMIQWYNVPPWLIFIPSLGCGTVFGLFRSL